MPAAESSRKGVEPPVGRRRARLHRPRQLAIERGHRQGDLDQPALGHARQDVEIARDERRFGHDADRVAGLVQDFQDLAHDAVSPLDRLVGIGVGADRHRAHLIARLGEFLFEQRRRIGLGEQLRLEIEPRRQAHIGVRRPRETIGAAVLAAAIGVDRAVEGDVRRLVAGDDPARRFLLHLGLQRRQQLERIPAVVDGLARLRLEAAGTIALGAASAPAVGVDAHADEVGRWPAGEGVFRDSGTMSVHEKIPSPIMRTYQEQNSAVGGPRKFRSHAASGLRMNGHDHRDHRDAE